jgi:hypothetical protein
MGPSDVKGFVSEMKGKALEAIVEQVRDGSTIRVCLIPSFHFFQVYVAGVQVTYTPFPLCNFFFVWQNIDRLKSCIGSIHGKTNIYSKRSFSNRSN